jgi:hypothetical protein
MRKYCAGIIEERATSIGKFNPARLAAKQLHVKLSFYRLDLRTERWLLHVEPLRGSCDVTFFGDGDEITKVSKFHCHTQNV